MEIIKNEKQIQSEDMFLKPEAREGQSDSTSIMERLGTSALALTAAAGVGQCASPARED